MSNVKDTPEHIQAQNIIVIHPGSHYLRIGRASDVDPVRILHAIARRRKPGGAVHRDCVLPRVAEKSPELLQELEDCRLQITHTLLSCVQSNGQRRYATPPQQIAAYNKRSQPEVIPDSATEWQDASFSDVVIGEEVLQLNPNGEYNVHFPIRRGELNLHDGVGGSLFGVLSDLQAIWGHVLQTKLHISPKKMAQYRAVLVIPDIYNRAHLCEFMTLLLRQLGFGCCFLVQDHVAATFGAGLGYACVVDVGDQKTSVSCVEDGISHPNTRVRFDYGGGDVTQVLYWLLQKCAFPYRECNEAHPLDAILLHRLKEEVGHVNLDVCGSVEKAFTVHQPQMPRRNYTLQVGDEVMVAPLSIFHTELLVLTGANKAPPKTQKSRSLQPHPEDCFDAEYLRETGRRNKENLEQSAMESGTIQSTENPEDDLVVDGLDPEKEAKNNDRDYFLPGGQLVGLDHAIVQSIERCSNDELKRKMYGCILIVGGGMKFAGIGSWLQNQVARKIPAMYRSEHSIVSSPKDMDPEITSWKGAAVMSCLESAVELWLTESEWTRYGLRILREKAVFMW
ncbi:actin-related protein 8 [Anopheles ziemanni]|uniref:actin-related protein 8 n=1 Tax=Anopheles coustani TaxID=139045 RepID=UPI00265B1884|nr:actin-related protein 8 [Anopheles coustani]XP_058167061.1 actin-related protein 8 [Anopheles ziemanni]